MSQKLYKERTDSKVTGKKLMTLNLSVTGDKRVEVE